MDRNVVEESIKREIKGARISLKTARRFIKKSPFYGGAEFYDVTADSWLLAGLQTWRNGLGDPSEYFQKVVDVHEEAVEKILKIGTIEQFWSCIDLKRGAFVQLLLLPTNRPPLLAFATPPAELIATPKAHEFGRLLDWLVLKALETGQFTDEWGHLMLLMSPQKKLRHEVKTYETYRRMIQSWQKGDGETAVAALREGEENFEYRTKDPFYSSGRMSSGGFEYVKVVDYQLAAIIRVLEGFGGPGAPTLESIHKWRW